MASIRADEITKILRAQIANLLRVRHGLDVLVVLAPPHSLPQTSSGKLSRTRAKALYQSGAFDSRPARVIA